MKYIVIFSFLSFFNALKFGNSIIRPNEINKKTFIFSGDADLDDKYPRGDESSENNNEVEENDMNRIIRENKAATKSDENIKNIVNESENMIKQKYNINELPPSGLTEEEEEEAREDSEFLSDHLEESAQNFSSSDGQNEDLKEKETESENIKKYQAEVINAMNKDTIYKKMDSNKIEEVEQMTDDSNEVCIQDYSLPCPFNFFRTSSGCVPLPSYEGPCNEVQEKLMYLYDNQKESWADICDSNWECLPLKCKYGTDYNSVCPINWIDMGKGVCRSLYKNNKCRSAIDFSDKTISEKKEFETLCGIRWRCKSVIYETNFDSLCPLNWTKIDQYKCKSPSDYNGPCPKISNFKKYNTEEGKKSIEIACLVNWPYSIRVNEYERDYNVPCPIGWFLLNNGFCRAPENYIKSSKCNDEVGFFNMTSQQKESFSISCNVDFPFKDRENCQRNYSFKCPLGWIPSNQEGFCKSPINYKSKICKSYSKFQNVSDSQRNYYLKFCNIDWPCISEIQNSHIYTKLPFNYSGERQPKWDNGPVDSITGSII
ncbi:CPW-WPC family protein, putative [Plasmodium chabaudi chabaudi]|uniref:CPW-WPC family protein, putative n=1 Tax=Plasmodium chabaudi chabaudi TaxID=31271 RepID=A0A1C6XMX7_PLACU|nr:CPW-WPC family protein, putative [Plasmodium chabaudi chabaudi]